MWEEKLVCDLEISPDPSCLWDLTRQQLEKNREFSLSDRWDISSLVNRLVTKDEPATFLDMLPLWVGNAALKGVSEIRIAEYRNFLESFELQSEFDALVQARLAEKGEIAEHDLGPIQDFLVLTQTINQNLRKERPVILEVGGGYGRLAELFAIKRPKRQCYVLTDSVPESLYYSWKYLSRRCRDLRIGAYFLGDRYSPDDWDIYVLPAWVLKEKLSGFDVVINVASIQEMADSTADAYFQFFKDRLSMGGICFFQNSRDFYYQREYFFPSEWKYLIKRDTPRSRTLDYPLEIMQVKEVSEAEHNLKIVSEYYVSLKHKAKFSLAKAEDLRFFERKKYSDLLKDRAQKIKELSIKYKEMCQNKTQLINKIKSQNDAKVERLKVSYENRILNINNRLEDLQERLRGEVAKRESFLVKYQDLQNGHRESMSKLRVALFSQKEAKQNVIESLKTKISSVKAELRKERETNARRSSFVSRVFKITVNKKSGDE